jgi:hypothetical protein
VKLGPVGEHWDSSSWGRERREQDSPKEKIVNKNNKITKIDK